MYSIAAIQRFEFSFELFWKAAQKKLRAEESLDAASPRQALQAAYRLGWIDDEQAWLSMLQDRNLTSHTYQETLARQVYERLPAHLQLLKQATARLIAAPYPRA